MDGYYDPHPRFHLECSLAVVGHPGAGAAQVAHALAACSGLPVTDVERWSEARAGRSRARVLVEDGASALGALDTGAVLRAIARKPYGFLCLTSGCLATEESRAALAESCRIVFVSRPVSVLRERIQAQLHASPGSLPEFVAGAPQSSEALESWLASRRAVETLAHAIIEAGTRHASRIADDILASLDRMSAVRGPAGPSPTSNL